MTIPGKNRVYPPQDFRFFVYYFQARSEKKIIIILYGYCVKGTLYTKERARDKIQRLFLSAKKIPRVIKNVFVRGK